MRLSFFLFCSVSLLSGFLFGENPDRLFYDAVRAEANGELRNAVQFYQEAATHSHSANLHGNLANLYFKLEQYGRSILHYRKALLLRPDDRELKTNLAFAIEISGIPTGESSQPDSYYPPNHFWGWSLALSLVFWAGMTLGILILPRAVSKSSAWALSFLWVTLIGFLGWGTYQANHASTLLSREVIVLQPQTSPNQDQLSKQIPLRRFAGSGSSANTTVQPGESLYLDLDESGKPKAHPNNSGVLWYLARSLDGSKKGWLREDEFSKILEN
jgi:tetratricopeptide (TPR) repeat protein